MPDVTTHDTSHKPKDSAAITWGPVAAVVVSVAIYVLSQVVVSIFIAIYTSMNHWSKTFIDTWIEGVWPQFIYVVFVEAISLGMLWRFLKRRKATFKTVGFIRPKWRDAGYSLVGFAIYFPILIAVMVAIKAWVPSINTNQQQQLGFTSTHGPQLILVFISLVLLPPIAEEILARGFLYLGLKARMKVFWAALLTSLLFASAHLQFGSNAPLLWTAAIDTFILSWVLIYLREATGGLWASIGLHMIKNFLAFGALFLFVK
jgi:membrane protease YdiL (CAAX protease family)